MIGNITRRSVLSGIAASMTLPSALRAGTRREVGMQLILAVDMSKSVDEKRHKLQLQGYAAALKSPQVLEAIRKLDPPALGAVFVGWSFFQKVMIPWSYLNNERSLWNFASVAAGLRPSQRMGTDTQICLMMEYCLPLFDSTFYGGRLVLDISGDGADSYRNRTEEQLRKAKEALLHRGVTVNGLPIIVRPPDEVYPAQPEEGIDVYYKNHVITGPGAFVEPAEGYEDFERAIKRKLVAEIA